ncbi:MAG: hypothetical protein JXA82_10280, partial [Sedimentisphaerales bacterium]|nr:hypothetical protein [Sedimentisphaerales bacterium]
MKYRPFLLSIAILILFQSGSFSWASPKAAEAVEDLSPLPDRRSWSVEKDWLIDASAYKAKVCRTGESNEIALSNGLITRTFRLSPNGATTAFENHMTGESIIRGVKPETMVTIDGVEYEIGGLKGQPNYAYLLPEWLDQLRADPKAFRFVGFETGKTEKRFEWKRKRYSADLPWPPPGVSLRMDYRLPSGAPAMLSDNPLPSDQGRDLLLQDDFENLSDAWKVHCSNHPRSSFQNEGKVGELYTPVNTCVYVERTLPVGVRLIECSVTPGTDNSASWGPGITLVWPGRIVKFYLRPGKEEFGVFDGAGEHLLGKIDISKSYRLRIRITEAAIYCEASLGDAPWGTVHTIPLAHSAGDPAMVRLGKTSRTGGSDDFGEPGELGRCRIDGFRAYGQMKPEALTELAGKMAYMKDVLVSIHYELYDSIPLIAKWMTIQNDSDRSIRINEFSNEVLAIVEYESSVESPKGWEYPNLHVETDYAFLGMDSEGANKAVFWQPDPEYMTQVNYLRKTPCLLVTKPPIGPAVEVGPGKRFETFRTYLLIHDDSERERKGLAVRRMMRTIVPWVTENPIMMHVRSAQPDAVRRGIDQCAETGFEMIILTFGSGFNIENDNPEYIAHIRELVDYAHSKGIEIGGYSLLASRRISDEHDVVNPETGKPGGFAAFGNSPCIGSKWGQDYFRKLYNFFEKTGFDLLEHDGSYPGDVCASTKHPGHEGLADSQWKQWKTITDFYKWCRGRGVYLNVPDFYYLSGTNKSGMGYRETNWSLPRAQQIIHGRQNIYDGTWEKTPSMGWMFVPLTQYHGGGAAATIEPLNEHLDAYGAHLANNFGAGVQACYRGPRLYDTDATKAVVKKWVDFYKKYRPILDSDIIHLRRAD